MQLFTLYVGQGSLAAVRVGNEVMYWFSVNVTFAAAS
jgi:hypothetical protein